MQWLNYMNYTLADSKRLTAMILSENYQGYHHIFDPVL
jgi:hypothetical protein